MTFLNLFFEQPLLFFVLFGGFIIALSFHEMAHAWMGKQLGDRTAEEQGRLTMNPLAHIDPFGLLLLLVGGFGYAKPVPYNPYRLKYPTWGPMAIAAAGPGSNIILGTVAALGAGFFVKSLGYTNLLVVSLTYLGLVNFSLALFNLVPLPPLDGSKALLHLLDRPQTRVAYRWLEQNGSYLFIGLILLDIANIIPVFGWISVVAGWMFDTVVGIVR